MPGVPFGLDAWAAGYNAGRPGQAPPQQAQGFAPNQGDLLKLAISLQDREAQRQEMMRERQAAEAEAAAMEAAASGADVPADVRALLRTREGFNQWVKSRFDKGAEKDRYKVVGGSLLDISGDRPVEAFKAAEKPEFRNPIAVQDPSDPTKTIMIDPLSREVLRDPQGNVLRSPDTRDNVGFKGEAELRKEFEKLPEVQGYKAVLPAVTSAFESAGQNSRASDLDLVFAVGKTLDPTSVVREGEQIMIMNSQSLPDWVAGAINRVGGGAGLQPAVRRDLLRLLKTRASAWEKSYKAKAIQYRGLATEYGMPPERIVLESLALPSEIPEQAVGAQGDDVPLPDKSNSEILTGWD